MRKNDPAFRISDLAHGIEADHRQREVFLCYDFTWHRHAFGIDETAGAAERGVEFLLRAFEPGHGQALLHLDGEAAVVVALDAHVFHLRQTLEAVAHIAEAEREQIRVEREGGGGDGGLFSGILARYLALIVTDLPAEKQKMLERLHNSKEVLRGRKVLVVDDQVDVLEMTVSSLKSLGFDVLAACDGKTALQILQNTFDNRLTK